MRKTKNLPFFGTLISITLLFLSCTKALDPSKDPKRSLTDYISQSFSVKTIDDKSQLLKFLTGDVKARLGGWSDDQFKEAFIEDKREFVRLSFKEVKEISTNEVQITYELTYIAKGKGQGQDGRNHEAKITNKKLCQLVLEQGKWLISSVRNIKELVEFKNELSLP